MIHLSLGVFIFDAFSFDWDDNVLWLRHHCNMLFESIIVPVKMKSVLKSDFSFGGIGYICIYLFEIKT